MGFSGCFFTCKGLVTNMDSPENVLQSVVNQMSFTPNYTHFCLLGFRNGFNLLKYLATRGQVHC